MRKGIFGWFARKKEEEKCDYNIISRIKKKMPSKTVVNFKKVK